MVFIIMLHADKTEKIIEVFYKVYNTLGYGFLEIVLELKAAEAICDEHKAQLINYLKSTDKEVGLLLNFGKKPEFKRAIFTHERRP